MVLRELDKHSHFVLKFCCQQQPPDLCLWRKRFGQVFYTTSPHRLRQAFSSCVHAVRLGRHPVALREQPHVERLEWEAGTCLRVLLAHDLAHHVGSLPQCPFGVEVPAARTVASIHALTSPTRETVKNATCKFYSVQKKQETETEEKVRMEGAMHDGDYYYINETIAPCTWLRDTK